MSPFRLYPLSINKMVANRKKQTDLPGKNPDQSIGLVADSTENATMSQDKFVFKQDSRETEAGRRGKFQEMFHQTERKASQTANRGEKGAGAHTHKKAKKCTQKREGWERGLGVVVVGGC